MEVTVQVLPQGELNRAIFPITYKNALCKNSSPRMKYPKLTLQFLMFLIRALFFQKGSHKKVLNRGAPEQFQMEL
jgi:hypothetical protein